MGAAARGLEPPARVADVPALVQAITAPPVSLPACPLMHGTGMWLGAMLAHDAGGTVVTLTGRSFDAHELWAAVAHERVTMMTIVGDAFAKPLIAALDEAADRGQPYDTATLKAVVSSGVMFSAEVKEAFLDRVPHAAPGMDWTKPETWEFFPLDEEAFPAVSLARRAGRAGGTAPAVYNAANEVCVQAFLDGEIRFTDIVPTIERVLAAHDVPSNVTDLTVDDVLAADAWARARAASA